MRAFIFSLDAFVAFTLALMAIYSLVFFSSVPSAYYYLLTQGHYLSRDTLLALSLTQCSENYCKSPGSSILDNLVIEGKQMDKDSMANFARSTIGYMIPVQFGYALEFSPDGGNSWSPIYDTAASTYPWEQHKKGAGRKFAVATQIINFGYSGSVKKLVTSPYNYTSCSGQGMAESGSPGSITGGTVPSENLGLITCGVRPYANPDGSTTLKPYGNIPPDKVLQQGGTGPLVPASDVNLVKLVVFI